MQNYGTVGDRRSFKWFTSENIVLDACSTLRTCDADFVALKLAQRSFKIYAIDDDEIYLSGHAKLLSVSLNLYDAQHRPMHGMHKLHRQ